MILSELKTGERGIIVAHHSPKVFRKRLLEMGFIPGEEILVVKNAPLKDPVEYHILGYNITLRRSEAETIEVKRIIPNTSDTSSDQTGTFAYTSEDTGPYLSKTDSTGENKHIRVAFVGNPNCGKTSLFNAASGASEHVGNYSGVTVSAKTATYRQDGYTFELTDLPGTYSFSSYSPEERFVQEYLFGTDAPDVVLNVVDASNLERNLYMTTQIMESGIPMVVALNMWDELEKSNSKLDLKTLNKLIGIPMVPTIGRTGFGVEELFAEIIHLYEHSSESRRIVDVQYPELLEEAIAFTREAVIQVEGDTDDADIGRIRPRFIAIKLLEEDAAFVGLLSKRIPKIDYLKTRARYAIQEYERKSNKETQESITNGRYGFVRGALQETYSPDYSKITEKNLKIDRVLTHPIWGYPIFLLIMFLTFQATFVLGEYPMKWIEMGVNRLGSVIGMWMTPGPLHDLIVDGVIAGVGGVLVFLPNIVILYICISLMEDTGYLARAAFIMDRIMHGMGLHGKSFIPLLMGFGCNVPAIMATRTIESRNARMVTMLVNPFMSCSARLPIYLLLAGTFFPDQAGFVLFGMYLLGIIVAVISALFLKRFFFSNDDTPFVMELPPYRIPTAISVLLHMWQRSKQYLQKMGTTILVASIVIWALGYFPHSDDPDISLSEQQEQSYIGQIGHAIQPVFEPLHFDWKMSVALLTGVAAKEIVVSTMGVLYDNDAETTRLPDKLRSETYADGTKVFSPTVALAFMAFSLLYVPCIATVVAIGKESGSWKWAGFQVLYSIVIAWIVAFMITLLSPF